MSEHPKWVALHFEKFLRAVEDRSVEFVGAYWLATLVYYDRRCIGLPNDDIKLRAICGNPLGWDQMKGDIFQSELVEPEFFRLQEDGRWHQVTALAQYREAVERCAQAALAANKRWSKQARKFPIPMRAHMRPH